MNNNKESDDEITNSLVESIGQEQSEEKGKYYIDEVTLTFMYLSEFLEAMKKNADAHLKKIKLDKIYSQFKLIKEIKNKALIATISNNYPSISKDQKEIEQNIERIKQHTLNELLNLSFKTADKTLATMLALVIEQFKEDSKERRLRAEKAKAKGNQVQKNQAKEKPVKLSLETQKAILTLMVTSEMKSIVKEWEDIIKKKENSLIDDYLIDFMEDISRIGYLEGLLDSESRLANYHHRLIAGVHVVNSRNKVLQAFNEKIRPVIEKIVKEEYSKGYKRFHNDLAENIRKEILQYLNNKKVEREKKTDKPLNKVNAFKYKDVIDFIEHSPESRELGFDRLITHFKKNTSKATNDFLLKTVRDYSPPERVRGKKQKKKIV